MPGCEPSQPCPPAGRAVRPLDVALPKPILPSAPTRTAHDARVATDPSEVVLMVDAGLALPRTTAGRVGPALHVVPRSLVRPGASPRPLGRRSTGRPTATAPP